MVSWVPVKRLRERFVVVGLGALKRRSSEEEPRLDKDSERKRLALMGAMKRRVKRSHNGFIQVLGCVKQTRRDAQINTATRSLPRDRVLVYRSTFFACLLVLIFATGVSFGLPSSA